MATSFPVSGSVPVMKLYLRSLQRRQAKAKLLIVSNPPKDFGIR